MSNNGTDHNIADDAIEIARLAALSELDYGREKKAAAERLGVDLATLNAAVGQARKEREKPLAAKARMVAKRLRAASR